MDGLTVLNMSAGLMSLVLGGFAIWLSLHLYTKAKDTEREVAKSLEDIKAQSEALQKLTGRWMDRFTRHATEPRPADEGLMTLVSVVASLPTTILTHLNVRAQPDTSQSQEVLLREVVDAYVALYYYAALSNVLAQSLLPAEGDFNPAEEWHGAVQSIIDRTANDFTLVAGLLNRVDRARIEASALRHLLDEAITQWQPHVRYTAQVFAMRREQTTHGNASPDV
jgi:hypothetical protein